MIEIGDFHLDLISDGFFEDDEDTFVRDCVERQSTPQVTFKGKSRIKVGFNSLLIRGRGHTVVVDPGTGDKPRPTLVSRYSMEWPRKFFAGLSELGVAFEDVDTVVLTHLHWDHCGGATRRDSLGLFVPTFPKATYHVQISEVSAALDSLKQRDDSFLPEDFLPLIVQGTVESLRGDSEIFPGLSVSRVGGHTKGLQVVTIGETERAVYLSDLVPTSAQIPLDCYLSYDLDPEELRRSKQRILSDAAAHHDLLLFVHAPRARAGYLIPDGDWHKLNAISV